MKVYEAYLLSDHDVSVLADSPELAREKVAEKVDDYFGNPIEWKTPVEKDESFYQSGSFYSHAYDRDAIIIGDREVFTK